MRFSTFSTGFSTTKGISPIRTVIQAAAFWKVLDENAGILPFIKKKVEGFSLHSTNRSRAAIYFSPIWNGWPQVFNTGPLPFFRVEKAGKHAVFHTGKSCCSRARREQTPPVSLRSTDSPFCRCATSSPGRGKSSSGMGPLAVRKSFRLKCKACGTPEAPSLRELAKPSGFD